MANNLRNLPMVEEVVEISIFPDGVRQILQLGCCFELHNLLKEFLGSSVVTGLVKGVGESVAPYASSEESVGH